MSFVSAIVKVRTNCGVEYLARCEGRTASSTSADVVAAERAAAKHFGVLPRLIRLHANADGTFLAIPKSDASPDWSSATQIMNERMRKQLAKWDPR